LTPAEPFEAATSLPPEDRDLLHELDAKDGVLKHLQRNLEPGEAVLAMAFGRPYPQYPRPPALGVLAITTDKLRWQSRGGEFALPLGRIEVEPAADTGRPDSTRLVVHWAEHDFQLEVLGRSSATAAAFLGCLARLLDQT
jgi:hypothetical protein